MGDGGARQISEGVSESDARRYGAAYPFDTSVVIKRLLARYEQSRRPQSVSFRQLVPWIKVGERATHYLHPYPAKLLPQIAHFFLAAKCISSERESVLDPFGGTGTVALEAILSGRRAIYADVNPLARLIAAVKTRRVVRANVVPVIQLVRARFFRLRRASIPNVVNIEYWFDDQIIQSLSLLRRALDEVSEGGVKDLLLVTFSAVAKKLSNADPRLSVPVRRKGPSLVTGTKKDIWTAFETQLAANLKRMEAFSSLMPTADVSVTCAGADARALIGQDGQRLASESVDLIITSPPYAGAQKYIRSSSLNLGWLGLASTSDLAELERRSIGREHFRKDQIAECPKSPVAAANRVIRAVWEINRTRAMICATYLSEMHAAIDEMNRVLKPGGRLVLVVGNNEVCGLPFKSSSYLQKICEQAGFHTKLRLVDEIKSRGLMTKRNRSAGIISREWVLLFEKPLLSGRCA